MGNRAIITSKDTKYNKSRNRLGIYVHWNGGRDSINAFLAYAKAKGVRGIEDDESYCIARLAQIIGNFFGGTTSVGVIILSPEDADNKCKGWWLDNGVYFIDNQFKIVEGNDYSEGYDIVESLEVINQAQPIEERLTDEELTKSKLEYEQLYK